MKKTKTKRKAATTVYFGCRIDAELAEQVRQRARDYHRPVGAELALILEFALPAMDGYEKRMDDARRESYDDYYKQKAEQLKKQAAKAAKEGR
jgi:hypothetical protein